MDFSYFASAQPACTNKSVYHGHIASVCVPRISNPDRSLWEYQAIGNVRHNIGHFIDDRILTLQVQYVDRIVLVVIHYDEVRGVGDDGVNGRIRDFDDTNCIGMVCHVVC
mgnify:CR=1 FL=1